MDTFAEVAPSMDARADLSYLVECLGDFARVPTAVPLGFNTLMEPDDPKIVQYVQNVVRPRLTQLGYYEIIDVPKNQLVVRLGQKRSDKVLLIQNYTITQHHNLMNDPFSGRVGISDAGEAAVFGQGVSQCKAHQAVMLTVLRHISRLNVEWSGTLYWAINNEGRSSHDCSKAIIAALDQQPSFGILQMSTDLKISMGNRGRIDINIHVRGRAAHSSTPGEGLSAIDGAHEVISRLRDLKWTDTHPLLGGRHALVYKLQFEPVAPHTLPSDAFLTVDRRLLPGDDAQQAVEEVRDAIGDMDPYEVDVQGGVYMNPALTATDDPWVSALHDSHRRVLHDDPVSTYGQGTFDAGGPAGLGIPTVMYGASGGIWPLGTDYVGVADVAAEANVLTDLILSQLTVSSRR